MTYNTKQIIIAWLKFIVFSIAVAAGVLFLTGFFKGLFDSDSTRIDQIIWYFAGYITSIYVTKRLIK